MKLEGRKVLLVGGASGIGYATADSLYQEGAHIHIVDYTDMHDGRYGTSTNADVTSEREMERAISEAIGHLRWLDIVIYTAGVQRAADVEDTTWLDYDDVMDVNLRGFVRTMKMTVNHLRARRHPSIVTVASVAGITNGGPGLSVYSASKGAMIAYTRSLAAELAPKVRVNCVAPGWTDTPFNKPVVDHLGGQAAQRRLIARTVPLKRQAQPAEIAKTIVFLASDDASYITGHTLVVDGGLTI